ncbi:MAG: redoxin domain-containing protein [Chitinophagaceae bacterium]
MKFSLFVISILLVTGSLASAQGPQEAGYLRFPTVPPFTVVTLDSTNFTKDQLKRNTPTLIMYFNPECEHCKHQADSIVANMEQFKKVQILMASYAQPEEISTFYNDHNLKLYPNIHVGRDTKYFFQPFYKILNLPFLALYDKKGKLLTTFEGTTPVAKLLEAFNKN